MNKELTPLEALEIIYNSQDIMGGHDSFWKAYRIIENALKEYDGLQFAFKITNRNEGKRIHYKLKALEIIKNKRVNTQRLFQVNNAEEYNEIYSIGCLLKQEEYELLREILK